MGSLTSVKCVSACHFTSYALLCFFQPSGMAPIDFSIEPEHQGLDPFSSAKSLLAAAKKTSTSFTHTSSSPSYSPRAQGEISNNSSGSNSDSSSVKDGNELNKSKMPLSAVEKPPTSRPMAYSDKISSSTLAPPPSASSSSMYRPPPAVPSSLSTIMTDASTGLQQPSSMASPSALSRGRIAPPYSSKPLVAEQPISDIKMDDFMASFSMVDRGIKNTAKSTAIPATASSSSTSFSSLRKVGTGSGGSSLPSAYSPSTPTLSLGGSLSSPSGQVNQMSPINSHTQSQSHYTAPQQIIQQSNLQPALQGSQMYSSLQGQIPGMGFDTGPAHASSMQFPPQGILTGIGNSSLGGIAAGGSNAGFPYQQQQQQQQQQYQQHQQYQQQQQYQQYQQNQTVGNDFSVQQPVPFTTSSSSSHVQYSPQYQNGPNAFQQAVNPYPNSSLYQNPVASSMANGNGSNMPYNNNNSNNSVNKNLDPFSFLD